MTKENAWDVMVISSRYESAAEEDGGALKRPDLLAMAMLGGYSCVTAHLRNGQIIRVRAKK